MAQAEAKNQSKALDVKEVAVTAVPDPLLIAFQNTHYNAPNVKNQGGAGTSLMVTQSIPSLIPYNFNDKISSIIVVSGTWEIYKHTDYKGNSVMLTPGVYPTQADFGAVGNDAISSIYYVPAKPTKPTTKTDVLQYRWKECEGETLIACKKAINSAIVKDEFFKVLKDKFGIDVKNKEYDATDNGICLLNPAIIMNGFNYYTCLVKFPLKSLLGGFFASVRVVQGVAIGLPNGKEYELQGFIISFFSKLNFVQNKQYSFYPLKFGSFGSFGPLHTLASNNKQNDAYESKKNDNANGKLLPSGPGPVIPPNHIYPKNWKPISGDTIKTCQQGLNAVKNKFFAMAKERGYTGSPKDYTLGDTGICWMLKAYIHPGWAYFIGLVRLTTLTQDGLPLYTFYASIRFGQIIGWPTNDPFELEGFIISRNPFLQWVSNGLYRFGSDVKPDDKAIILTSISTKDKNDKQLSFVSGRMDYLPTGDIQKVMDSYKDDIKKKCGIIGDLDTFQVVTATACTVISHL